MYCYENGQNNFFIIIFIIYSGYDGNKNWLFSTVINKESIQKLNPIKRVDKIKIEDSIKKSIRTYHQHSDIFHKNADNSSNIKGIKGYKNASNVFNYTEPYQTTKGIRSYHLQSDILFTKNIPQENKISIKRSTKNNESKIEPKKEEKIKKKVGKEFLRTYDEWDLTSKKTANYKNKPNPDNGLVFDFTKKPVYIGKTNKRLMPEKNKETVPKIQRGKKQFLKKNNEDPGSSLVK